MELKWNCQRFSSNGLEGQFSDVKLACYFFAILEEQKFQVKQVYTYIKKYWYDWFPDLPSYQAFNYRPNRLGGNLQLSINGPPLGTVASC